MGGMGLYYEPIYFCITLCTLLPPRNKTSLLCPKPSKFWISLILKISEKKLKMFNIHGRLCSKFCLTTKSKTIIEFLRLQFGVKRWQTKLLFYLSSIIWVIAMLVYSGAKPGKEKFFFSFTPKYLCNYNVRILLHEAPAKKICFASILYL